MSPLTEPHLFVGGLAAGVVISPVRSPSTHSSTRSGGASARVATAATRRNHERRRPGITDADRERMAAFADNHRPSDLLGEGESVKQRDGSEDVGGEATEALAEHLRERLTVGEVLYARSAELRAGRSPASVGRSLSILADSEPAGLAVTRERDEWYPIRWRIRRVDARGDRR